MFSFLSFVSKSRWMLWVVLARWMWLLVTLVRRWTTSQPPMLHVPLSQGGWWVSYTSNLSTRAMDAFLTIQIACHMWKWAQSTTTQLAIIWRTTSHCTAQARRKLSIWYSTKNSTPSVVWSRSIQCMFGIVDSGIQSSPPVCSLQEGFTRHHSTKGMYVCIIALFLVTFFWITPIRRYALALCSCIM